MGKWTEKREPFYSPGEETHLVLPSTTEDSVWEAALLLPLNVFCWSVKPKALLGPLSLPLMTTIFLAYLSALLNIFLFYLFKSRPCCPLFPA